MPKMLISRSDVANPMSIHNQTHSLSGNNRWWRKHAKPLFILALIIFVATLLAASARMVVIAFESQPDCIPHSQSKDSSVTQHRAAKSSC